MTQSPLAIANFFIDKAAASGKSITPMKLVKLVYIAHGWHLGLFGRPLLEEEVEAWKYGPVVCSVYHAFKKHGRSELSADNKAPGVILESKDRITPFLEKIWVVYGDFSGPQLSTITHQKKTPWDVVWNEQGGRNEFGAVIPNDLIQEHYKEKARG